MWSDENIKSYAESTKEAEDYSVLKNTIAINITVYNEIIENEKYQNYHQKKQRSYKE